MKKENTLKALLVVTLFVSIIQFLYYFVQLGTAIFDTVENPLIPRYLWKFVAFPLSILSALYLIIAIISYFNLRKEAYNFVAVLILFVCTIVLALFAADVYQFINSFNPYGS